MWKLLVAAAALVGMTGISNAEPCIVADPTGTPLNVRNGRSTSAQIVAALKNGVTVSAGTSRGDWVQVVPLLAAAAVTLVAGSASAKPCIVADPTDTPLNFRKDPSSSATILGALNNGTSVSIKDRRGDWVRIVPQEGKSGWVYRKYLDCPHASAAAEDLYGQYMRVYDQAHLAAHPDQLVTHVDLSIVRSSGYYKHNFTLHMRLRDRNELLKTEGYCKKDGRGLRCLVECDGGGIRIEPRGDNVMMHLERIRMVTCDQDIDSVIDGGEEVRGGKDDRAFHLYRVPKGN
jgi:SH3-like domain-containing protein